MTPGERTKRIGALNAQLQLQMTAMQNGMDGVLVDMPGIHRTIMDLGTASGLDAPEDYWIDPASETAQQAQQSKGEQAQAQSEAQEAEKAALLKLENDKIDKPVQFDYYNATLKAETEEAKLVGNATLELEKQQAEGRRKANEQDNTGDTG